MNELINYIQTMPMANFLLLVGAILFLPFCALLWVIYNLITHARDVAKSMNESKKRREKLQADFEEMDNDFRQARRRVNKALKLPE